MNAVIPLFAMKEAIAQPIDDEHQRCRDLGGLVAKDPLDHPRALSV